MSTRLLRKIELVNYETGCNEMSNIRHKINEMKRSSKKLAEHQGQKPSLFILYNPVPNTTSIRDSHP